MGGDASPVMTELWLRKCEGHTADPGALTNQQEQAMR